MDREEKIRIAAISGLAGLLIGSIEALIINHVWYIHATKQNHEWAKFCEDQNNRWYEYCHETVKGDKHE